MLTVAGLTPSLDITYRVAALTPGAIHRPLEVVRCAGGKALNLARAAANLGAAPAVVAVLGGATGDGLAAELEAAGIAVSVVPTPVETRVCVSVAADDAPGLTEFYAWADPVPEDVWGAFGSTLAGVLDDRPGWLAVPGGAPRGLPGPALAELVAAGVAAGRSVAVDTHGAALEAVLTAGPALIKVNRDEAAELLGDAAGSGSSSLAAMAARVRERAGGATVVLTDGEHGCVGLDDDGCWRAPVPEGRRGRYPVGSGDSFLAGLLVALDGGDPLPAALALATAAGAANAAVPGPGRFDGAEARASAAGVRVQPES